MQDDADLDLTHTSTAAFLHPGQGEPGEGDPTQAPLSAGLWRNRLSLWRTRVLEIKPAGHSRPLLLLVRLCDCSLRDVVVLVCAVSKTVSGSLLNFFPLQGDRWHYCHGTTIQSSNWEVQHHRTVSKVITAHYYSCNVCVLLCVCAVCKQYMSSCRELWALLKGVTILGPLIVQPLANMQVISWKQSGEMNLDEKCVKKTTTLC